MRTDKKSSLASGPGLSGTRTTDEDVHRPARPLFNVQRSAFYFPRSGIALAILFALITFVFADVLLFGNILFSRDLALYHFPMKYVVREAILSGEFPFWNRLSQAGQPLAANPAYELFYPPQWLTLLPSYSLGFHLHILFHLYLAGAGMYLLLRALGCRAAAAFFGAFSFALGGPLVSLLGLLPFLFSMAWLPWCVLFAERWLAHSRRRDLSLLALCLGMQALICEPVTMVQTWLLLAAWAFARTVERRGEFALRPVLRAVGAMVAASVGGLLVGAVQFVPALDHAGDSVRSIPFDYGVVAKWSMPLVRPLELFFVQFAGSMAGGGQEYYGRNLYPNQSGPFVFSIYCGLLVAVLATAGLYRRAPLWKLAVAWSACAALVAFGANTPLLRWLYDIGLFRSIRYPEKFVLSMAFVLIVFAALQAESLMAGERRVTRAAVAVGGIVVASSLLVTIVAFTPAWSNIMQRAWELHPLAAEHFAGVARQQWLWMLMRALAATALVAWLGRRQDRLALIVAALFLIVDLMPLSNALASRLPSVFHSAPPTLPLIAGGLKGRLFNEAAVERMSGAAAIRLPAEDRYWVMRNGLYPMMSSRWGVATAMEYDFDETSLLNTRELAVAAAALRLENDAAYPGAFMTFSNATRRLVPVDESGALAAARGEIEQIVPVRIVDGPQSSRYYFADRIVPVTNLAGFIAAVRGTGQPGRAAFVPRGGLTAGAGRVITITESRNAASLVVDAEAPAFLVASVTNHKYWSARVDGATVPIVPTNVSYQGVAVPAGRHLVEFTYRNPMLFAGAVISLLAITSLILWPVLRRGTA